MDEKERKALVARLSSEIRKEVSRLVASGIRRIKEASDEQYEAALFKQQQLAALYERRVVASLIRGVLDELEVDRKVAMEIEEDIRAGRYSPAHDKLKKALTPGRQPQDFWRNWPNKNP